VEEYFAVEVSHVSQFAGFHELARGGTSIGGLDGRFIVYRLGDDGLRTEVVLRTQDYGYILIAEARVNDWASAEPVLDAIAASFRLE
jgi:hypothetical protein